MKRSEFIYKNAVFSDCKKYRYALYRIWDNTNLYVMFIGLNPSIADEFQDDPTIRRCINYARYWGFGGLIMGNLFAFRATNPKKIIKEINPIGKLNTYYLVSLIEKAKIVICSWGNNGNYKNRDKDVLKLIVNPYCLKITKTGQPSHPLYLKSDLKPREYKNHETI